jgi:hypothetical protein
MGAGDAPEAADFGHTARRLELDTHNARVTLLDWAAMAT